MQAQPQPPVSVQSILQKIERMGREYAPGNASKPGHLYNPIPFPEFAHVPYQRGAVEERFSLMRHNLFRPFGAAGKTLLDVGCHTGYNCYRFREMGFACTGIELDALTAEIAQDVNSLKNLGIRFLQGGATVETLEKLGHFDVMLFLSVFQWIVLAEGFEKAKEILRFAQSRCEFMFFETSMGTEGKMKLPQLPDKEAVAAMLAESGLHAHIECLAPVEAPGGNTHQPRYVFRTARTAPVYAHAPRTIPLEVMQNLVQNIARINPVYRKENAHFLSIVAQGSMEGKNCAYKIVQAKSAADSLLLYREHEFLRRLEGPHFLRYVAHGLLQGTYVLMTEWVPGKTLQEALPEVRARCRAEPELHEKLCAQLDTLLAGLRHAGIRHRDVWEKNLLWDGHKLTLIDFGWAAFAEEANAPTPPRLREPDDEKAVAALKESLADSRYNKRTKC